MKVTHVITRMIVGGAQENTLFSVKGLAVMPDYDVSLVTGPETGLEGDLLEGREEGLDVVRVPALVRSIDPVHDVRALESLYKLFRRTNPDIVHTHSSKAGVLGRLAARMARVPIVVHTLHSLVFHDYQPRPVNFAYRTIKRSLAPLTDHYVSVSDNIRERAIAARIGVPERHSTIRSGFLTDDFVNQLVHPNEARARLGIPEGRVVVGVVARFFPLKGHAEILEAARLLVRRQPDVLFVFAGGGPLLEELQQAFAAADMANNAVFLGRVPPEDIPTVFSSFDILAHASLREGLARVIPQGVLAGLPVVCYNLDGSGEIVRDGYNGFLVPPRHHALFADRLDQLVGDEVLRKELGGRGREQIRVEFSVDEMVRRLAVLYSDLLARGAPKGRRRAAVSA